MTNIVRKLLFVALLLLTGQTIYSQQVVIDSLTAIINDKTKPDHEKIFSLADLGMAYCASTAELDKALSYMQQATILARQQEDARYAAYSYSQLAVLYANMDSIKETYSAIDTCLQYIEKTTNINTKSRALTTLVNTKLIIGDNENVLDWLHQAMDLQKTKGKEADLGYMYYMMYGYYYSTDQKKSIDYIKLYLQETLKYNDNNNICRAWGELGGAYLDFENKPDSAAYSLRKALQTYEAHPGEVNENSYAMTLIYMAKVHQADVNKNGLYVHPDSILYYANKAKQIADDMKDIQYQVHLALIIADVQKNQGNNHQAELTAINAIGLLENTTGFTGEKMEVHDFLYQFYKSQGRYKEALTQKELAADIMNTVTKQKYIREGAIAEAKYKVKEKDQELLLSQKREQQRKTVIIAVSVVAILLIIVLAAFYQMRLKNSKQKEKILAKEKEEANLLARLKEEEARLEALEKELLKEKAERQASEMNRLQKELIIGTTQLEKKSDMLEAISNKLENDKLDVDADEIKRLLADEKKTDEFFDEYSNTLKNIHPEFYSKLQEKAENKLTALDLKYCTYIYMNLSSKDMAMLLFVEPITVRITKHRLKQKLKLSKDEDLNLFIQNIIDIPGEV